MKTPVQNAALPVDKSASGSVNSKAEDFDAQAAALRLDVLKLVHRHDMEPAPLILRAKRLVEYVRKG